ncbi:hypothetical protein I317_04226 [Kwoniella heveanensis CBS 569]|nr:hypothetical protein I317_04226 [Kwoniella heveanensis CBS 569]
MNGVDDDVLEDITHMESTFYQEGYQSGFEHGKLHGIFEGRELGNEKSWELWEEIGYYEGWASLWVGQLESKAGIDGKNAENEGRPGRRGKEARALNHARGLLELIASFPTTNPTPAPATSASTSDTIPASAATTSIDFLLSSTDDPESPSSIARERDQTDLASLISQIRAKYKLLCSSLGTRPRLAVAQIIEAKPGSGAGNASASLGDSASSGIETGRDGPVKGVDTRQLRF